MSLQIVVGAVVAAVMADHFSRVAEVVMQKKIHASSNKTPRRVKLVQSPTPHSISWGEVRNLVHVSDSALCMSARSRTQR